MNRIIFVIISGTIMVVVTLTWVYQRNEPKFLSPVVDLIARLPLHPSSAFQTAGCGRSGGGEESRSDRADHHHPVDGLLARRVRRWETRTVSFG